MSSITRRLPQTNIARMAAIRTLKLAVDSLTPASVTLPADITTNLANALTDYSNAYDSVIPAEAALYEKIAIKNNLLLRTKTITTDFLKVLRITIDRSVLFADGLWAASDIDYYNLDETGGNLPNLRNEDLTLQWANNVVNGEAARKAAKPTAPDMVNPTAAEVAALIPTLTGAISQIVAATNNLTNARNNLNILNPEADRFILRAWDFLEANYSNLDDGAKRNMLRQFGVTYVSTGTPNTFTFLVKDATAAPLEGAKAVIIESGAEALANEDGRITLSTNSIGALQILISYPGKQSQTVTQTIPDDAQGQTYNLPDITLID